MNPTNTYNLDRISLEDFTYTESTRETPTSVHPPGSAGHNADSHEMENSSRNLSAKANSYFSDRIDLVRSVIEECNSTLIFPGQDGRVIGSWLLTEIGVWDNEMERLVTLTDRALIVVKYDFIALRQLTFCKVNLQDLDSVCVGDLIYPPKSLMIERKARGVKTMWNHGLPIPVIKTWNPFSKDVPMKVFTSHPLYTFKDTADGNIKNLYDFEHFALALSSAIRELDDGRTTPCKFVQAPILVENYVGLHSWLYNKTHLGFSKVRGKFSF